jgi:methylmalonyl-CoA/ethylmalonyl-CoA epimerase
VRLAMLPIGESAIELLEPQSEKGATAEWLKAKGDSIWHICLEVDDIEGAIAELRAKGVKLQDEVPRSGHGGHKIAFIDPASTAGILVELVEMVGEGH